LGNAQIGADRREQVGGKYFIDRDKVSLFGETLKFAKVRLNHGLFTTRGDNLVSKGGIIAFLD
jgi:hypothetical protein